MARRDHNPYVINTFRGLYTRGDSPNPPAGYATKCRNMVFTPPDQPDFFNETFGGIRSREIYSSLLTLATTPVRWYFYFKSTGARVISLNSSGVFRDHTAGVNILTVASATDFHGITINDRFYITPHDGLKGITGEFVYVYDPALSSTARKAAGVPAVIGTFAAAVSATNGTVEPGLHVVSVSFETNTGFITKPAAHVTVTAPNPRKKIDLTNIPVGGAGTGTIARWIWLSKRVVNYDGNPVPIETFFVAKINDNTTTSLTIDAYDSQLVSSSDPYSDVLSEIPAGTFLTASDGRLVMCGSFTNNETLYVSNTSEPEAIDAVDGLLNVAKGDGGTVFTTRNLRGLIYAWKGFRTFSIEPSDDVPKNWRVRLIDTAMGSTVYGVGEVFSTYNADVDKLIVSNSSGAYVFNGAYQNNILYNVLPTYFGLMDISNIKKLKTVVDPIAKRIHILFPTQLASGLLEQYMIDYNDGLDINSVKVSSWDHFHPGVNHYVTDMHVIQSSITARTANVVSISGTATLYTQIIGSEGSITDSLGAFVAELFHRIPNDEFFDIHVNRVILEWSRGSNNTIGGIVRVALTDQAGANFEFHDVVPINSIMGIENITYNFTDRIFSLNISSDPGNGTNLPLWIASILIYLRVQFEDRVL